ncbi:MAG: hypothetical protein EAX96_10255 [Candidatus Lokiarchaeota archaeon]|nr:hypothetical protein [Candidatus Lokiarchaeota archaeon]
MIKMFDEITINLNEVRSYRDYPRIIEDRGCPRCESVLLISKIIKFSNKELAFGVTCENCGLYFVVKEIPIDDVTIKLQFSYEQ